MAVAEKTNGFYNIDSSPSQNKTKMEIKNSLKMLKIQQEKFWLQTKQLKLPLIERFLWQCLEDVSTSVFKLRKTVTKQLLFEKIGNQMQKIRRSYVLVKTALFFSAIAKDAKKLKKLECLLLLQLFGMFVSFNFPASFIFFVF